jgi:glycosyltransferase involved in cell wall biosynthesis
VVAGKGTRVPAGDAAAWAVALRQMAATLDRYDPAAIRAGVVERFSPPVIVARLTEIYRDLLQGGARP